VKSILSAAAIAAATLSLTLTISVPARAENYTYCADVEQVRVIKDDGNHPNAYDDGYREGTQSAQNGDEYEPRSVGGEFARGFEEGYYGRPYAGQQNVVPTRQERYTNHQCRTYHYSTDENFNHVASRIVGEINRDFCYSVEKVRVIKDDGNHPNAYDDGYREGTRSAQNGDEYEPRSAGGEFARGFEDGYYGRPSAGQQNVVPNRSETYSEQRCPTTFGVREELRRDWNNRHNSH